MQGKDDLLKNNAITEDKKSGKAPSYEETKEWRDTEPDLQTLQKTYETILDHAEMGILVTGAVTGDILYANHWIDLWGERYLGGTPTENRLQLVSVRDEAQIRGRMLRLRDVKGNWNGQEVQIRYITDVTDEYEKARKRAADETLIYLQTISKFYDFIVAYNLTRDTYEIRFNKDYLGQDWESAASYSELVEKMLKVVTAGTAELLRENCSIENQLKMYRKGKLSFELEYQAYDEQGERHWVVDRNMLMEDPINGDVLGISLCSIIDKHVLERKDQNEQLKIAQNEARCANEAKNRFLSNVSHDIRTPMNAVIGYTAIAAEYIADRAMVEDCLKKIALSGKHLQELINDVLDMSRIESGKDILELSEFCGDAVIDETVSMIKPTAAEKKIGLHITRENIMHHHIYADHSKLRRIMVNILSNAVKFTKEGGEIWITYEEQESEKAGYGRYTFTVQDTGIGMSPGFLEHIFDVFSRERAFNGIGQTGTGLGMSIVKRYVDMMDGTIQVESQRNVGTTISVVVDLKLLSSAENNESIELSDKKTITDKHILLVEDNRLNLEMAKIWLSDRGMVIDTAEDGQQAVERLEQCADGTYDFVLMDIQMPVMDGVEATKQIRASKREYLQQIPIIALTANVFSEDIQEYLDAGMNGHIAKPFSADSVMRAFSGIK